MEPRVPCPEPDPESQVLRYLRNDLPAEERDAFEVHVLECDDCSELLETARLAREVMAEAAAPAPRRPWVWGSLAAGLAAAVLVVVWRPNPRAGVPAAPPPTLPPQVTTSDPAVPSEVLAEMARVDPPVYVPLTLRADAPPSDPRFEKAMGHYARGEHAAAAAALRDVTRAHPRSGEAWFFLGVSALVSADAEGALPALERAAELGQQPYAEAAPFFAAKAELRAGRLASARARLLALAGGHGDFATEAGRLLERLDAAQRKP
jgi:tetratricopeptide (TPR) repeat protein